MLSHDADFSWRPNLRPLPSKHVHTAKHTTLSSFFFLLRSLGLFFSSWICFSFLQREAAQGGVQEQLRATSPA